MSRSPHSLAGHLSSWIPVAVVYALILVTVPIGRVVSLSLYRVLSDPVRRARYDRELRGAGQPEPGASLIHDPEPLISEPVPVKGRHALRGSFSTGVSTRSGGDFEMYTLSYLYAW